MAEGFKIAEVFAELKVDSGKLESGLAKGRQALSMIATEIKQLKRDLDAGAIGLNDYNERLRMLSGTATRVRTAMNSAYATKGAGNGGLDVMTQQMGKAASGAKNFGMAMMQLGSIVDDAQYGFQGVVNNIGPMALALSGGNASVAAAAQLAAVGIAQLIKHWDDLRAAFGKPIEATVRVTTEHLLDENSPETIKQRTLQMEKERDQRVKQLDREATDEEKKAADAWRDAIKESPNAGGQASIASALAAQMPEHRATREEETIAWDKVVAENPALVASAATETGLKLGTAPFTGYRVSERDLDLMNTTVAGSGLRAAYEAKLAELERQRRTKFAEALLDQATGTGPNAEAARAEIEKHLQANPEALAYVERAKAGKTKKKDEQVQSEQHALGLVHTQELTSEDARRHAESADARKAAGQLLANRNIRGQLLANPAANVDDEIRKTLEAMKYSKDAIAKLLPVVRGIMAHDIQTQIGEERSAQGGTEEAAAERLRVKQEQQELRPLGLIRSRDIKDPDAQRHAYQQEATKAAGQMMANRKIREKLLTDQNANIDNEIRALLTAANHDKNEIEKMLPMIRGIMGHTVEQDIVKEVGAHGGNAKEAAERLKSQSDAQGGPSSAHSRAIAANRQLRQQLLRGQKVSDDDVAKAMKAAGYTHDEIKAQAQQFREEMEQGIDEEKKLRASKQGITEGQAGTRIADEEEYRRKHALQSVDRGVRSATEHLVDAEWNKQQRIMEHNKPQFMGLAEYAKKLAVGGFETQKWQHELLTMNRGIRDATENVVTAIEAQEQAKSTYD